MASGHCNSESFQDSRKSFCFGTVSRRLQNPLRARNGVGECLSLSPGPKVLLVFSGELAVCLCPLSSAIGQGLRSMSFYRAKLRYCRRYFLPITILYGEYFFIFTIEKLHSREVACPSPAASKRPSQVGTWVP